MRFEHKFAVLLGRGVDLLRRSPDAVDDHKAALRSLVELTSQRSTTVRLRYGSTLTIEGVAVPPETPFATVIAQQMRGHGVAAIFVAHKASALDLLTLLIALARPADELKEAGGLEGTLREANVLTVALVTAEQARKGRGSVPAVRVTDALKAAGVLDELEQMGQQPPQPPPKPVVKKAEPVERGVVLSEDGAPMPDMLPAEEPESEKEEDIDIPQPEGMPEEADIMRELNDVSRRVVALVEEDQILEALEETKKLLRERETAPDPDTHRAYTIALQRIATSETIHRFADLIVDELYQADAVDFMRFVDKKGTQVLLDKLVAAPSYAERRAYLKALKDIQSGIDVILSMFSHHQWYVVRNMADLVGELQVEEAIPALGKAAGHTDPRVRRAAGMALARIGTGAAAAHLRSLTRDPDPSVRLGVGQEIKGRGMTALVMPLVAAVENEEDTAVLCEYYRAMGRIGSQEAIQVLIKVAESGGSLFKRKPVAPRLAAIEALGAAGTAGARAVLLELTNDRDRQVRDAAQDALVRAETAPPSEG
jgi:HEAT repeat protein